MEKASFQSNGFITGSTLKWVIIISQVSLFMMIPLFALGVPILIITGFLLAAMVLGFKMVTVKVVYIVDESGITKDIQPELLKDFWKKKTFQYFPWEEIKNFKAGKDAGRDYEEFYFLTINTTKGKKLELNTKKSDENSFHEFERVFRHYVEAAEAGTLPDYKQPVSIKLAKDSLENQGDTPTSKESQAEINIPSIKHNIIEKPNFYQTTFAKGLTILFIIFCVAAAGFMLATGLGHFTSIFRLAFILVPGTAYMIYRVYVKKG
jgi:hypothetical protein